MAAPSSAEILTAVYARLTGNATIVSMTGGRIANHLQQDTPLPCMRLRWETAREFDTKDSTGYDGTISLDFWTDYRGDLPCLQFQDAVMDEFHNRPLTLTAGGQSLILRREFFTVVIENDGITHHAICQFRHVATT